jgi:uncharacterized protein with NRDE domain
MPAVVAPQDLEAGGTWMGLNTDGLFVGLTNRATATARTDRRSRGLLVRDALEQRTAASLASKLATGLEGTYNPFHLVYSDGRDAFLTHLGDQTAETRRLEPGIHVVCNRGEDDPASGKARGIRHALEASQLDQSFERVFAGLANLLRDHDLASNPLENPCVHSSDFGTRSSAILSSGGPKPGFWYAPGPPCESKFENVSHLLDPVQQARSIEEQES